MNTLLKPKPQAIGAHARAASMTSERRKEISRRAILKRHTGLPLATHQGNIKVGDIDIECHVLETGQRLLTQSTFLEAIGRSARPEAGKGVQTKVEHAPAFLTANNLKLLITKEISRSSTPVEFVSLAGRKAHGYVAELLPEVCKVYLSARDADLLTVHQKHIAARADILVRGLATIGIVALVDEATGYQEIRDRKALQAILDKYLSQSETAWAKRFPDEFYKQMFRLKGWIYPTVGVAKPGVVGTYTKDLVYARLAPSLVEELEKKNPSENGVRRSRHHQWLTSDTGHPALNGHITALIGLMRVSESWAQFKDFVDKAFPVKDASVIETSAQP